MGREHGLERREALALASVVVDLRVTQMVNGVAGNSRASRARRAPLDDNSSAMSTWVVQVVVVALFALTCGVLALAWMRGRLGIAAIALFVVARRRLDRWRSWPS